MLTLLGLILNLIGTFLLLIPYIPRLYRTAHKLPPIRTIEQGEKQLYVEGELKPNDPGFDRISEAFFQGSPPLSESQRLDELDNMPVHAELGDRRIKVDGSGWTVKRILKVDDEKIHDAKYKVEMYSDAGQKFSRMFSEVDFDPPNPYLSITSYSGAFPELIEDYKVSVFFRAGAVILFSGFLLQAIDRLSIF